MGFELRKGQVAIWVILGIFLVAVVLLFILFRSEVSVPEIIPGRTPPFSVDSYLSRCIAVEVDRATHLMLPQGGFVTPTSFRVYNKTSIEYVCNTFGYFEPCINQHPVLIDEMEEEIKDEISSGVNSCIIELAREVEDRGGSFTGDFQARNLDVELDFDKVVVNFDFLATVDEKGGGRDFEDFRTEVKSSAYNLGIIAQEIATQEASFCYFESVGYSLAYPRYKVVRKMLSDQSKIYILTDRKLKETMMVAVKSCALPEGMPG